MFANPFTFALMGLSLLSHERCVTSAFAFPDSFTISRPCKKYDGDGCSIPFGFPFFFKTQFTKSCDRHDICYHCGVAYGIPRSRCDNAFRNNTLATCTSNYLSLYPPFPVPPPFTASAYPGRNFNTLRKLQFLKTLKKYGAESLELVLQREIKAFIQQHQHQPSIEEFLAWLLDHEAHVRILAEWAKILDGYFQQVGPVYSNKRTSQDKIKLLTEEEETNPMPDQYILKIIESSGLKTKKEHFHLEQASPELSAHKNQSRLSKVFPDLLLSRGDRINWCLEIDRYLQTTKGRIPLSAVKCPDIGYLVCDFFSEVYYLAVSFFASSSYHKVPEFYCHQSFVKKCLPALP
ncbi:conodipine_vc3 prepropeptide [Plakobranchus ocellatus]|uniref:Conodipine_vc3 prepropeptide n=1 Tax=Plakobranchus ocellatus TaxID=259542 RepID=A0AAV3ZUP2_9GAST|nr:conodipine_vc3 prepropeptide [Plakobranchus ocellatus]